MNKFRDHRDGGGALGLPAGGPTPTPPAPVTPPAAPATPPAPVQPAPQPPAAPPAPPQPPQPQPPAGTPPAPQGAPQARFSLADHPEYKALADKHAQAMRLVAKSNPALHAQIKQQLGTPPPPATPPAPVAPLPSQPRLPNGQFAPLPQAPPPYAAPPPGFVPPVGYPGVDPLASSPFADPFAGQQELTPQMVQQMIHGAIQQTATMFRQQQEQERQAQQQAAIAAEISEVQAEVMQLREMKGADGQPVIPEAVFSQALADTQPFLHDWQTPGGPRRNIGLLMMRLEQ
ncbi:MAG TPA: hypothetical protein PLP66_14950, partial [Phycisphaerae bacterium]|nr:hypothetical protein [Phycisphaerae bacterium]